MRRRELNPTPLCRVLSLRNSSPASPATLSSPTMHTVRTVQQLAFQMRGPRPTATATRTDPTRLPQATTRCLPLPARPRSRTQNQTTVLNDASDKDYDNANNADGHNNEKTLCGFARRRAEGVAAAFPLGCVRTTTRLGGRRERPPYLVFFPPYYRPYFSRNTPPWYF